jgi:hypothetical protein
MRPFPQLPPTSADDPQVKDVASSKHPEEWAKITSEIDSFEQSENWSLFS